MRGLGVYPVLGKRRSSRSNKSVVTLVRAIKRRKKGQATSILEPFIVETTSPKEIVRLREITRSIIDLVENLSGCPVVVSEDASLRILAASGIARGANRIHTILCNLAAAREPD